MNDPTDPRYPIGRFEPPDEVTEDDLALWIQQLEELPGQLREAVAGLSEEELDTPYRPDGWTVRQVVHHVPDSHLNAYVRTKWALTEDEPVIKAYDEKGWADLADTRVTPIEVSLDLLDALHERWVTLLRSLTPEQLDRRYLHPESGATSLARVIGLYAWHGRHHLAHVTGMRDGDDPAP